ncbi:MAG: YdjY domain-containing protein [Verrucomicrobiota bacterium]
MNKNQRFMNLAAAAWLTSAALLVGGPTVLAQTGVVQSRSNGHTVTNSPLRKIDTGVFEIGNVRLDKNQRTIRFPAVVNMDQGAVEYLLVNESGKVHESVFRTEAEPYHIHLATLLVGAKESIAHSAGTATNTPPLAGNTVSISASWKTSGGESNSRGEDLIFNIQTRSAMSRGAWVYTGSRIVEGTFLAQRDGSVVSIISDPDALINNPRPGRENDEIWQVNTNAVPPAGTPVQITIKLEDGK